MKTYQSLEDEIVEAFRTEFMSTVPFKVGMMEDEKRRIAGCMHDLTGDLRKAEKELIIFLRSSLRRIVEESWEAVKVEEKELINPPDYDRSDPCETFNWGIKMGNPHGWNAALQKVEDKRKEFMQ